MDLQEVQLALNKLFLIVLLILIYVAPCNATITFTNGEWDTSFLDCADWAQDGVIDCDGVDKSGDHLCDDTTADQITSDANYSQGGGGKGYRHWEGGGSNNNGGSISVAFAAPLKEFWIRFYQRYEVGFQWDTLNYDKLLYIHTGTVGNDIIPEYKNDDQILIYSQGGADPSALISSVGTGWAGVMGGATSDGLWHMHEIHIKMDTDGTNGIGQYWVDGVLIIDSSTVDYSDGDVTARLGWTDMIIGSNQTTPNNGGCEAVDFDDIAISQNGYIGPVTPAVTSAITTTGYTVTTGNVTMGAQ